MKMKDLEAKIADRAQAVVHEKIAVFKREIDAALTKLFGNGGTGSCEKFGSYGMSEDGVTRQKDKRYAIARAKLQALRMAINDLDENKTYILWPYVLMGTAVEEIRNELLSKMDLMQQLLVAKSVPADASIKIEGDSVE